MTRHPAREKAEVVRAEPRRRGRPKRTGGARRQGCPRCRTTGDPRTCACMRQLRRLLDEATSHVKLGRSLKALEPLSQAAELMGLLGLDAAKARGERTDG